VRGTLASRTPIPRHPLPLSPRGEGFQPTAPHMTNIALFCGLLLVALGVYGYTNAADPSKAGTSLIPAGFGVALLLCAAVVIWKDKLRKHVMHVAALVGVLGFVGGFMPVIRSGGFDLEKSSVKNGLVMSAICAVFVFLCVQSFIAARKAREKATV